MLNIASKAQVPGEEDMADLEASKAKKRRGHLAAAWTEDVCDFLKITRIRVVTGSFIVKSRLLDISEATEALKTRRLVSSGPGCVTGSR